MLFCEQEVYSTCAVAYTESLYMDINLTGVHVNGQPI